MTETPESEYTLESQATVTWILNSLLNLEDDDLKFSGLSMSLQKADALDLQVSSNTDLFYEIECKEFVSGDLTIEEAKVEFPANLDFGSGECDQLATVTTTTSFEWYGQTFEKEISFDIPLP
jgi:hypothetical protein